VQDLTLELQRAGHRVLDPLAADAVSVPAAASAPSGAADPPVQRKGTMFPGDRDDARGRPPQLDGSGLQLLDQLP
jgi:hypothetical protein